MLPRSVYYYRSQRKSDQAIRQRMKEIANTRVRYGFWRIVVVLRREGWPDNHKRMYRIYKEEGLNLRSKRPRRNRAAIHRTPTSGVASTLHECWSMDFVADNLFDGRKFRALTVIDNWSRKCLKITTGKSLRGDDVVQALNEIVASEGVPPRRIKVDNGSEFISKALDKWAYDNEVELDFSRPGKPTDNPFIESFNGSFRDECLNLHWFVSFKDAQQKINEWNHEYNNVRPHSALANLSPEEFISSHQIAPEIPALG